MARTLLRRRQGPSRGPANLADRKSYPVRSYPLSLLLSLDAETTGLDLRHGCKPFLISTCTPKGRCRLWEWAVDPLSRQPRIPHRRKLEVAEYISGKVLVFHNAKFDLRALSEIGFEIYFEDDGWLVPASANYKSRVVRVTCKSYEDTALAAHNCSSSDEYGRLKSLALRHLRFPDDDEKDLEKAVLLAANYCRSKKHPLEATLAYSLTENEKGERSRLTNADYWLPKFVYDRIASTEEVPEQYRFFERVCSTYARRDAERTILLWDFYRQMMDELDTWKGYERKRRLLQVVYKMETGGVTIKKKLVDRKFRELMKKRTGYEQDAIKFAKPLMKKEINLNSHKDLPALLYDKLKLPCESHTDKGNPSTDKKALGKLIERVSDKRCPDYNVKATNFLRNLIIYRAYLGGTRFLRNYQAYALPHNSFHDFALLYPSLHQTGAGSTTRFSSSNPNGQNISKIVIIEGPDGKPLLVAGQELEGPRLRDVFGPLPGKIWYDIDYSQLELRIFAYISGEKSLIEALAKGYDFHEYVATRIFNKSADKITKQERRIAKNTNYAIIFGGSPWRVDITAGISGAYDQFAGLFPNVAGYMQESIARARRDGYIRTEYGYKLDIPHSEPYKAVSYKVQGTAGDIIKNAMIKIDERGLVDWEHSRLPLQIHDSLIAEFTQDHPSHSPATVHGIMDCMVEAGRDLGMFTPVDCDRITSDWGHGEKVEVTKSRIKPIKEAA